MDYRTQADLDAPDVVVFVTLAPEELEECDDVDALEELIREGAAERVPAGYALELERTTDVEWTVYATAPKGAR